MPQRQMSADLTLIRGRKLPMTLRQALAVAVLALEHVATCSDDEDQSAEQARRLIAARLRQRRRGQRLV